MQTWQPCGPALSKGIDVRMREGTSLRMNMHEGILLRDSSADEEMAQSVKSLSGKHENPCSDLQHPCRKPGVGTRACSLRAEGEEPGGSLRLAGQVAWLN